MQSFMPPRHSAGFVFFFYSVPGIPPLRGSIAGLLYTTRASAGSYIRRAKPAACLGVASSPNGLTRSRELIKSSLGIRLPRRSKRAQRDAETGP